MHQPHAASSAAGIGLDQKRKSYALCRASRVLDRLDSVRSRHARNPCLLRNMDGSELFPHGFNQFRTGPHKQQSGVLAHACKCRPFGQKTVSGVNRLTAAAQCCGDQCLGPEIALARCCGPYAYRSGRQPRCETIPVDVRHCNNGLDPQSLACTNNAHGDFATVCHEETLDDRHRWCNAIAMLQSQSASGRTRPSFHSPPGSALPPRPRLH